MTGKNENVNYKPMFLLSAMFMGIIGSGFMSKEDLPVQNVPSIMQQKESMKLSVEAPVHMAAGDVTSVNKIVSTVMGDKLPAMVTPVLKSNEGLTSVYQLQDYEVTLENFDLKKSSEQEIFVSVRKVDSGVAAKESNLVLTTVSEDNAPTELGNEVVSTYKMVVNVTDEVKPVIKIVQDEDTITEGDSFDAESYFESAIDNVDGELTHETDSDVDSETPGVYTVTYRATDKAGNESSASVTITVEEKEEPVVEAVAYSGASAGSAISVSGSSVASAALAQVGVTQDCTALVSNALAAAGISFHGYPAAYMSLGTVVSAAEAQPGDILYYANGGTGYAHVAIYLGNGQAVHGGWHGSTTVVDSAYVGSGPVFIHIAQ